jgi:TetR/AcrR family fatty acid metabolism transcriptional regulator
MKAEARSRQILECAKKVFAERGFHAANISHICAEAGIGRGTLYQYFKNKKAVFEAILRQTLDRVHGQMQSERPVEIAPVGQVTAEQAIRWSARRLHRLLSAVFEDQQTLRILLREAVGLDVDIEALLGEIDDALITTVETDLRAYQEAGWVRPLDPRVAATLMVGAVEKMALIALRSDEPVDLMKLANEISHLHGIGVLSDRVKALRPALEEDDNNQR